MTNWQIDVCKIKNSECSDKSVRGFQPDRPTNLHMHTQKYNYACKRILRLILSLFVIFKNNDLKHKPSFASEIPAQLPFHQIKQGSREFFLSGMYKAATNFLPLPFFPLPPLPFPLPYSFFNPWTPSFPFTFSPSPSLLTHLIFFSKHLDSIPPTPQGEGGRKLYTPLVSIP